MREIFRERFPIDRFSNEKFSLKFLDDNREIFSSINSGDIKFIELRHDEEKPALAIIFKVTRNEYLGAMHVVYGDIISFDSKYRIEFRLYKNAPEADEIAIFSS